MEGGAKALFMLGASKDATAVHVKTEDAKDWSVEVPLRSLGAHGLIEVCIGCTYGALLVPIAVYCNKNPSLMVDVLFFSFTHT